MADEEVAPGFILSEMLCEDIAVHAFFLAALHEHEPGEPINATNDLAWAITGILRQASWALVRVPQVEDPDNWCGPYWMHHEHTPPE